MAAVTLKTLRLEAMARLLTGANQSQDEYLLYPSRLMTNAGYEPDRWQSDLLSQTPDRMLLLCARQAGKSTVAAAIALQTAILRPDSLVLLLSPALRQSGELFRDKLLRMYDRLSRPVKATQETALSLALENGSRIISLPGSEGTIRGFSGVSLLVIDEASRVPDELYFSVRPMLSVSNGRLAALTTPYGKRGWFFKEWTEGGEKWRRVRSTAEDCPRVSKEFLAEERRSMGARWYNQEYLCEFVETNEAVLRQEDIDAALTGVLPDGRVASPLFSE